MPSHPSRWRQATPAAPWDYSFPAYSESARTQIRGRAQLPAAAARPSSNPPSGYADIYFKSGTGLCSLDAAGAEYCGGSVGSDADTVDGKHASDLAQLTVAPANRIALHRHPGIAGVMEAAEVVLRAVPGLEIVELGVPAVGLMSNALATLPEFKRELYRRELDLPEFSSGSGEAAAPCYGDVRVFTGGKSAWQDARLPLERSR